VIYVQHLDEKNILNHTYGFYMKQSNLQLLFVTYILQAQFKLILHKTQTLSVPL